MIGIDLGRITLNGTCWSYKCLPLNIIIYLQVWMIRPGPGLPKLEVNFVLSIFMYWGNLLADFYNTIWVDLWIYRYYNIRILHWVVLDLDWLALYKTFIWNVPVFSFDCSLSRFSIQENIFLLATLLHLGCCKSLAEFSALLHHCSYIIIDYTI